MIKNVVFDFGQVLVHFEPIYMTKQYIQDENDAKHSAEVIFDRLYWDRLDDGTITDDEVVERVKERLPEHLRKGAEAAYRNWIYHIPEVSGMRELMQKIKKEKGVRVFILSNISRYFAEHADEIPILREAEYCIFSAVCGHTKPEVAMFDHLCRTCKILPEETVIIDDSAKNIAGAEAFGIKGYLFDGDVVRLQTFLEEIL